MRLKSAFHPQYARVNRRLRPLGIINSRQLSPKSAPRYCVVAVKQTCAGETRYPENDDMKRATTKPKGVGRSAIRGRRRGAVMATAAVCEPSTKAAAMGTAIPNKSRDAGLVCMLALAISRAGELATVLPKRTVPATVATTGQSMPRTTPSLNLLFTSCQ